MIRWPMWDKINDSALMYQPQRFLPLFLRLDLSLPSFVCALLAPTLGFLPRSILFGGSFMMSLKENFEKSDKFFNVLACINSGSVMCFACASTILCNSAIMLLLLVCYPWRIQTRYNWCTIISKSWTITRILGTIYIYPAMVKSNKYATSMWKRQHKPEALLRWVTRFHVWRYGS